MKKIGTTYYKTKKDSVEDRIELEFGDSKQPDFKPQVKMMRWDNEVNFSIRAEEHPGAQVVEEDGKLKYKTPDYEVHQFELDPDDVNEDGGIEFGWWLAKKPKTNQFNATVQTRGLKFTKQPTLPEDSLPRPGLVKEQIEGSIVAYHENKKGNFIGAKNYKTGKAFHIYTPKIIDAEGNYIWGQLDLDEEAGILTVTVEQQWLDNAIYPVFVDPTFGYTSIGASTLNLANDDVYTVKGTPAASTDVDKLTFYGGAQSGTISVKGFIGEYTDSSSCDAIITNGITDATAGVDTSDDWNDLTYSTKPSVTASTNYWVSYIANGNITGYYDIGSAGDGGYDSFGESYTSPDGFSGLNFSNLLVSVYATYTVTTEIDDSRNAKIIGSVDDNDARSSKILGIDNDNSARSSKITGTEDDNDSRSAKLTGVDTTSSSRSSKINGQYGAQWAYSDSLATPDESILRVIFWVDETKPGDSNITYYLSADGGSNWEAVTEDTPHDFSNSGQDLRWRAYLEPTTDKTQAPTIHKIIISYELSGSIVSTRNAVITGQDTDNDARSAKISGSQGDNDSRTGSITGTDTTSDARSAKITGQVSTSDNRDSKITGSDSDNDSRSSKITGQDSTSSSRSSKITGTATDNDNRNAKITGVFTAESTRSGKVIGALSVDLTSTRNAKITGKDWETEDDQDWYEDNPTSFQSDSSTDWYEDDPQNYQQDNNEDWFKKY